MGRRRQVFQLLVGEDVKSSQVDLCVTVLASLGCRHVDDLAGTAFDDNEAVLPQGRALHRVREGGASVASGLEGVLMLLETQSVRGAHAPGHRKTYLRIVVRHGVGFDEVSEADD